jgi:hypothetical protein
MRWVLTRLSDGPRFLAAAGAGLGEEALRRRPSADSWAVVEIACHLRDIERVYAERFTKAACGLGRGPPPRVMAENGLHPKRGEVTIGQLANVLADHERRHVERIREIRATSDPSAFHTR